MHHVTLLWHVNYLRLSRFISNHIESQVWKTVIGFGITHAAPDWFGFKALDSGLLLDCDDHISESLFWSHGETHTVIEDNLLWFLREGLSTELDFVSIDSPIASISRLFHPENVFLLWVWLSPFKVISTEDHFSLWLFIVGKIETEHWFKVSSVIGALSKLSNESFSSRLKWVLFRSIKIHFRGWSETNQSWASEWSKISRFNNCDETQVSDTMLIIVSKASSISGRMSHNLALSIFEHLTRTIIRFIVFRCWLMILNILCWACWSLTLFREQPCHGWPGIKDNVHLLGWVSKPEFSIVSHIFHVGKVWLNWNVISFSLQQGLVLTFWESLLDNAERLWTKFFLIVTWLIWIFTLTEVNFK